jgi:hypothetical protein
MPYLVRLLNETWDSPPLFLLCFKSGNECLWFCRVPSTFLAPFLKNAHHPQRKELRARHQLWAAYRWQLVSCKLSCLWAFLRKRHGNSYTVGMCTPFHLIHLTRTCTYSFSSSETRLRSSGTFPTFRSAGKQVSSWIGRRPIVPGVAMNPVDHPHAFITPPSG